MPEAQPPLACQIYSLDAAQRARRSELFATMKRALGEVRELPDGIAARFAPTAGMWMTAAEFITLERRCCPFLSFALETEGETGPVWVRLTGPTGVKEFLAAELGLSVTAAPPQ